MEVKVSILDSIKIKLFGSPLIRAAKSGDVSQLADIVAERTIFVISKDVGQPVSLPPTELEVMRISEAAAFNQVFDGDIFRYDYEGITFVPIFTSADAVDIFCGAYTDLIKKVYAYRVFEAPGTMLKVWLQRGDVLIFNPQGNDEAQLTEDRTATLRGVLTGSEGAKVGAMSVILALPPE